MVKTKAVVNQDNGNRIFGIFCIGECGRKLSIEIEPGLVFRQVNFVCAGCTKESKYVMPKATASKFEGTPPGQTTIDAS